MAILYSLNTISNARYNMSTSVGASLGTFYSGVGVSEFNSGGYCRADIGVISSGGVVTIKSTNVAPIYLDATSADALRTTSWAAPSITGFNGTTDKLLIREKLAVYDSGPVQREWVTPDPVAATSIAAGTWTFRRWLQSRAVAPDYDYENEIWLRYGSAAKDTRYDIPLPAAAPTYIDVVTRPRTRQRVNIARTRLNATAQRAYTVYTALTATVQRIYAARTRVAVTAQLITLDALRRILTRQKVFQPAATTAATRQGVFLLTQVAALTRQTVHKTAAWAYRTVQVITEIAVDTVVYRYRARQRIPFDRGTSAATQQRLFVTGAWESATRQIVYGMRAAVAKTVQRTYTNAVKRGLTRQQAYVGAAQRGATRQIVYGMRVILAKTRQRISINRLTPVVTRQRSYVDPVQMYATLQQLYLATTTVAATRLIVSAGRLARFAIRGRVFITRSQQYYTRQIILLQRFTHIERRTVILVPDALGRPGTLTGRHTAVVDIAGEGGDG